MSAKLPTHLVEYTIQDMKVGESAWTTPWAMWADPMGDLWINGKYTAHAEAGGTVSLRVLRTPEGYHVDIRRCADYRWTREHASYVGGANPLPVVKLIE